MLSLQLAHQLSGKHILLVGAGEVAMTRIPKLLPTGCKLTVIAPEIHGDMWKHFDVPEDNDTVEHTDEHWSPEKNKIFQIFRRGFRNTDIVLHGNGLTDNADAQSFLNGELDPIESYDHNKASGWHMIMTCIPDPVLSEKIYRGAKLVLGQHVLCNVADNPPLCDFYFGSNVTLGKGGKPIQIMLSSNGNSPRFTALLKNEIERQFEDLPIGESVAKLGQLRARIRKISEERCPASLSKPELIKYRMEWIRNCTDAFGVSHCHEINVDKTVTLFEDMFASMSLEQPDNEKYMKEYLE